jgi:hypothetical protein
MDSDTTGNVIRVYAGKKVDFLTGLEVGEPYYAHGDGTISTSSAQINNADAPVLLGTAIGDGQLLRS